MLVTKQEETTFWNQKWGKAWSLGSYYPSRVLIYSHAFNEKEQSTSKDGIYQVCNNIPIEKILQSYHHSNIH
jgi:hypothetical protein